MPRIRNLTVAGVLAGATVLGGAGLAGAAGGEAELEDPAFEQLQDELQPTTEMSTGEGDETTTDAPTAPELPEQASDVARSALTEAPAFGEPSADVTEESDADADEDTDETGETEADDTAAEVEADNHGQHVSEVARSTEPGPDHGPTVSEAARQNGRSTEG